MILLGLFADISVYNQAVIWVQVLGSFDGPITTLDKYGRWHKERVENTFVHVQ